jgi:hypothetical protein
MGEQKDVDEYMNLFMDKIEQAAKGTSHENMENLFGGKIAQELIC